MPPRLSLAVLMCSATPLLAQGQSFAFTNVTVIPMDRERTLPDHTVVVEDGTISMVGPTAAVTFPAGATVLDGAGLFLAPSLADLHVHIRTADDLPVYLANGITTVLDMGGNTAPLRWKVEVASGALVGPHMFVARLINGRSENNRGGVGTVEEARNIARQSIRDGYDYLKLYNALSTEQFNAIMDVADRAGVAVIGHGVRDPGLQHILERGMRMVVHAEEYIYTYFNRCRNPERMAGAVELTKRTGAYVLPNLSAYEIIDLQWGKPPVVDSLLAQPEARYLHPRFRRSWQGGHYTSRSGGLGTCLTFLRTFTKALSDGGVPLLLGTDSPGIPGMYPGYSIHNDLRNLIQAGLTPFQAMSAGTRTAGEFVQSTIPDAQLFGVVQPGARGDLVLLSANPLDDVNHLRNPLGVMVNGKWYDRRAIDEILAGLAHRFGTPGLMR